ncbi:MAG TPA: FliM/FliN family flagellar motor switch protein [Pirellulaceae bacterium]|nr:FliM/FliN family flagellar motor switch protein [Pirellulaceae bacterium]
MSNQDYPVYDFLTASKVDRGLAIALKAWLNKFNALFEEKWLELAPTPIKVSMLPITAHSFEEIRSKWIRPAMAVPFNIGQNAVQGLFMFERTDIILLLMEILSETLTQRPTDRELTTIETSLSEMLFQTSAVTLGEAWPEKEPMPIALGDMDPQPSHSRLFTQFKEVIATGCMIRTANSEQAGPSNFVWVFAKDELMGFLNVPKQPIKQTDSARIDEANVKRLTIELCASLGTSVLNMNHLMHLVPGSVVRLSQRVDKPLNICVNDQPVLKAWPGQTDDNQCVLID